MVNCRFDKINVNIVYKTKPKINFILINKIDTLKNKISRQKRDYRVSTGQVKLICTVLSTTKYNVIHTLFFHPIYFSPLIIAFEMSLRIIDQA